MYIRFQKIKRDEQGNVISGSASLEDTIYVPKISGHSRHRTIESLGKVLWIDEDKKAGIFNSKTRGMVHYSVKTNLWTKVDPADPRIAHRKVITRVENIHTTFADAYLLLSLMEKSKLLEILRSPFLIKPLYQVLLTHLCHNILKNGNEIKCQRFYEKSLISWLFKDLNPNTLDCDSYFFTKMGENSSIFIFFRFLIEYLRKQNPKFGSICYVDSISLPCDIRNNPWNNHGSRKGRTYLKLILFLDRDSGFPIWFRFLGTNLINTPAIEQIYRELEDTFNLKITSATLDEDYVCENLFKKFNMEHTIKADQNNNQLIVKMPSKKDFPFMDLYQQCKDSFHDLNYQFDLKDHTYFGKCVESTIVGFKEYCYVYLDMDQALNQGKKFRDEDPNGYNKLNKDEQEWLNYKGGFFILISNINKTPKEILHEYLAQTSIENSLKNTESFLELLPLEKWNDDRISGKLLLNIIEYIMYHELEIVAKKCGMTVRELLSEIDGLESLKLKNDVASVKIPNLQMISIFEKANIPLPKYLDLKAFRKMILNGEPLEAAYLTTPKRKAGRKKKAK